MNTPQAKTSITPVELQNLLLAGLSAQLLDVRTPGEFATAHVPGAKMVPLDDLDPTAFLRERDAGGPPLYVLCQSGGRARKAIEKLERAGVGGCALVEGGTQGWMDAGLPVIRGQSNVLPLMRQVQIVVGIVSAAGAALALLVNPLFALLPLVIGCGLLFAGLSGMCGLAFVLAKMPWNRVATCGSCCGGKL